MKKTLYVSDLDGTLLNPSAELSEFTVSALQKLSARGVYLGAATARTGATAAKMLAGTGINVPVILMNGVCVLDIEAGEYIRVCRFSPDAFEAVVKAVHDFSLTGFFYGIENNIQSTYYENLNSPGAQRFVEERKRKYGKRFTKVEDFSLLSGRGIIYYSISDKREKLAPAAEKLKDVPGLRVEFYRDIYEEDCFFLEVCSAEASKSTAIDFIRKKYGFDKIIGFGDNYNDIPLLEACDEFHAVGNAVQALKERADSVIGTNAENGVALWLLENAEPKGDK